MHGCFPQARCQACKIAVAAHQAKTINLLGIKNIHGIDNHGRISSVFPGSIAVLLNGIDGMLQQQVFPFGEVGFRPVTINAFNGRVAVLGNLFHHLCDIR